MENEENVRYDFPVISEASADEGDQTPELAAGPNVKHESIFEAEGDHGYGRKGRVGSVVLVYARDREGSPTPFAAYFTFETRGTEPEHVVVTGLVPGGDAAWDGESVVTFADGTGRFEGRNGETMRLVSENPKRWG